MPPALIVTGFGLNVRDVKLGGPTVNVPDTDIESRVAAIVAEPCPMPVAKPVTLSLAIALGEDDHWTVLVISCVPPSVYVPMAWYCCVAPSAIVAVVGLIAIAANAGGLTITVAE